MSPTFSLYANFFALFVDVGYSGFVMRLPISFYPCYRLLLPKGNINSEVSKMKETSANVNTENESRKYYLSEFSYYDGEYEITFNILDISFVYETITVAITRAGRISQDTFPLLRDKDGKLYFEFGLFYENKIKLDDFVNIGEDDD